jgi:hypothetical protein
VKKKKVLIHSNHCRVFTGFGKATKNVLRYLHLTGKYELVELANGTQSGNPDLETLPWKCLGGIPSDVGLLQKMQADQNFARHASYGGAVIDDVIKNEKPDVYIGIEDIWAFRGYTAKPWWHKLTPVIWTTLDSLPMLDESLAAASQTKNFCVWASFAEREMKRLGFDNVTTLRGPLFTDSFFKDVAKREEVRARFGLKDNFIIGFVFRNQLRKSVPNILQGFKLFKAAHPESKPKLLLHTHWSEGWSIPKLISEFGVDPQDVLTTYFCNTCRRYHIRAFSGEKQDCPFCRGKGCVNSTSITSGVTDRQLNEIYNIMDVYCHPFTSGGQEIPVQEAKLAELITLVTNYSCGEDFCTEESGGLPLDWEEYREPGTQFIKATTKPASICEQLSKVWLMTPEQRSEIGKRGRGFVINTMSVEVVGKRIEEIIDNAPEVDWSDFLFDGNKANPDYPLREDIIDNGEWLLDVYKSMLNIYSNRFDEEFKNGLEALNRGTMTRQQIHERARQTAIQTNINNNKIDFADVLGSDDRDRRIAIVLPQSATDLFLLGGLLTNFKRLYPEHNIYVITQPQFFSLLDENPNIHKLIPYDPRLDSLPVLEGAAGHSGYFSMAFFPNIGTQKFLAFTHNGKDKLQFDLCPT